MKCTTNTKVMTFFVIYNIALPWILSFSLMFCSSGEIFNYLDILELEKLEKSSPLEKISKIESKYPYFGKTKSQKYTYAKLVNYTVKNDENCPQDKKQCGYLTEDSILCLNQADDCPINDIIISNQSTYSVDNITYNRVQYIDSKYIYYTNKQINNKIIFDLVSSIEHPLSRIETSTKNYDKIFKLYDSEEKSYYSGNIDKIKVYKQIYNSGITLKQSLESLGKLEELKKKPGFKMEYLDSNLFLYKQYAIPFFLLLNNVQN